MSHFPAPTAQPVLLTEAQAGISRQYASPAEMLEQAETLSASKMPDHRAITLLISTARAIMDGAVCPGAEPLTDRQLADKLSEIAERVNPQDRGYLARAWARLREIAGPIVTPPAKAPLALPCTCFGPGGSHSADCQNL